MKKQLPGYGHAYGGTSTSHGLVGRAGHGQATTTTSAGASSNLPSIFDNPGLCFRHRPGSGLQLDIKGLPNAGLLLSTTRERPTAESNGHRLSSSDSTADRIQQARRLHTSHAATRIHTSDGRLLHHHRGGSQPGVGPLQGPGVATILEDERRPPIGLGATPTTTLTPIVRRPPSSSMLGRKLPPIGAVESESHVTEEDEEGEGEGVSGGALEEEGETDESETDSEDEVRDRQNLSVQFSTWSCMLDTHFKGRKLAGSKSNMLRMCGATASLPHPLYGIDMGGGAGPLYPFHLQKCVVLHDA